MHSGLGVKTFVFPPSPRTLLALLHLFAPFFTPNRLKEEKRKTAVKRTRAKRNVHLTRSPRPVVFRSPRFPPREEANIAPSFPRISPSFRRKAGRRFRFSPRRSAIGGVHGRSPRVLLRKFAPQSAKRGAKIVTFRWHFRGNPLYLQQNLHRGRRATPHSHPYEETAVSPSQRRRLLPHHQ